jgi:Signal transduction histidine kinase regulating C4-dicarboxylate transport system
VPETHPTIWVMFCGIVRPAEPGKVGTMRLSVSLKIFLGFVAVVVAFSGAAVYELVRSRGAQEDLRRLNQVYLRLNDVYRALDTRMTQLTLLHRNTRDLIKTSRGQRNWANINRYLPLAQRYRDRRLGEIRRIASSGLHIDAPPSDLAFLRRMLTLTDRLKRLFAEEDRLYHDLVARKGTDAPLSPVGVQRLLRAMSTSRKLLRQIANQVRRLLSRNLSAHVRQAAQRIESDQSTTLLYSALLSAFALAVAVLMMVLAHFTLRPLGVLRAGARTIGQGDYSHRLQIHARDEIGELAAEFNAMAAAIEEREQRLIESERKAARAERLASIGRAAAQITHEVRNPLSAIALNAEMLEEELEALRDKAETAEAQGLLAAIMREVDRLTEVTEAYLQFARMPRPRLEVDDLGLVVQRVQEFFSVELASDQIRLRCEMAPVLRWPLMRTSFGRRS